MEQAGAKVNWDEKEDEEKDELDDASSVEDIDGLGVDFPDLDRYPDRVEMRLSIFDLHEMMVDGSIDLNPPYQRDEVWGLDKRKDFVRFLFENRVCSVIVLSRDVKGGMEGRPNVARCLDGKQRLTSIFQFMDGQFSFKHPKTGKHFWYKVNEQTHNRRVLPQERKEQFLRETISIHEYRGLTEPQERDRFQDLQLGTHLTVAERLQAMSTPCAKWIHQLRNEYLSKDSSLRTLINSYRGLDFRTIEQLASSIHYIEDRVFPKFDGDRKFLQDLSLPSDALKHDVRRVLDKMRHLASNRRFRRAFDGFPNCKTVAPIEFVLFGILIHYTTRRNCKDKVIADTLFTFRQKLRDNSDRQIRLNYDIWTFSWGLVDEILGTTRKPPQKPKTESTSDAGQLSKTASSSRTTVKAKRVKAEADQPATPQGLQTAGAIVQAARARDQRAAARSERMAVASAHPAAELASSRSTVTETMPCRTPDGTSEGGLPHSRSKRAIPFVELITRKKARIAPDLENAGNAIGTDEFQEIGRGRGRRLSSTAVNETSGASLNSSPPLTRSTTKEQETKTEF